MLGTIVLSVNKAIKRLKQPVCFLPRTATNST